MLYYNYSLMLFLNINNDQIYDHGVPECLFLAGFDQILLAHEKTESLFLRSEDLRTIFNLAGIVMPAVLLHGEIAGRWKKQNGKLRITMFRMTEPWEKKIIADCAESLWNDMASIVFDE